MSDTGVICFIIGVILVVAIAGSFLWNQEELARYQALKNKRRFSGRRLLTDEQAELDRLARKYWWY